MSLKSKTVGSLMGAAALGTLWTLVAQADGAPAGQPQAGAIPAPKHQVTPLVVHNKPPPHHPGVTPAKPPAPPANPPAPAQ